jgi:hypothetical protein
VWRNEESVKGRDKQRPKVGCAIAAPRAICGTDVGALHFVPVTGPVQTKGSSMPESNKSKSPFPADALREEYREAWSTAEGLISEINDLGSSQILLTPLMGVCAIFRRGRNTRQVYKAAMFFRAGIEPENLEGEINAALQDAYEAVVVAQICEDSDDGIIRTCVDIEEAEGLLEQAHNRGFMKASGKP